MSSDTTSAPACNSISEASGTPSPFLLLFTASPGDIPSFVSLIGFLGPLLGIAFAFDAISQERSGRTLDRVRRVFWCLTSADTNPELQRLDAEGVTTRVTVTTGLAAGGFVEIVPVDGDLEVGDRVVVGVISGGTDADEDEPTEEDSPTDEPAEDEAATEEEA